MCRQNLARDYFFCYMTDVRLQSRFLFVRSNFRQLGTVATCQFVRCALVKCVRKKFALEQVQNLCQHRHLHCNQ